MVIGWCDYVPQNMTCNGPVACNCDEDQGCEICGGLRHDYWFGHGLMPDYDGEAWFAVRYGCGLTTTIPLPCRAMAEHQAAIGLSTDLVLCSSGVTVRGHRLNNQAYRWERRLGMTGMWVPFSP